MPLTTALFFFPEISITGDNLDIDLEELTERSIIPDFRVIVRPADADLAGCTVLTGEVWQVREGGTVTLESMPAVLVDSPAAHEHSCAYDVVFPPEENGLERQGATSVEISAASPSAAGRYRNETTSFRPDVSITLSSVKDFSGVIIEVFYTPVENSPFRCRSVGRELLQIDSNGDVDRRDGRIALLDRPGWRDIPL